LALLKVASHLAFDVLALAPFRAGAILLIVLVERGLAIAFVALTVGWS
jgi:hypothetical protein